jgi:hypothetical protein
VGEGVVSTIGSSATHKDVLENPDHISKHILSRGLDAGTAFEILSIDIADVDVGENIGAKLQIDQANADKQIAQAKAEERRAMAVAQEQEMRARGRGGGRGAARHGEGVPGRKPRDHGLLPHAQRPGRHADARLHRGGRPRTAAGARR